MTTLNVRKPKAKPETPSESLVKKASEAITIDTPNGLTVTLKKPGILSQFRLVKILGEAAKNNVYVGMIIPITFVTSINGVTVNYPNTEREIEAIITRLDEGGVTAVMEAVNAHFGDATPDSVQEEVKN